LIDSLKSKNKKSILVCVIGDYSISDLTIIKNSLRHYYDLKRVITFRDEINNEDLDVTGIDEIIIVPVENKRVELFQKVDELLQFGVRLKITPLYETWPEGVLEIGDLKNVEIEDLLTRKEPKLESPLLSDLYKGKVILITGAAGSIGSEISRQLSQSEFEKLILVDQSESMLYDLEQELISFGIVNFDVVLTDIRNPQSLVTIFDLYKPNIIFHAAAYKHVPLMERYPKEAVEINIKATKNIANLAIKYKVEKFIFISTDKAINPISVMGSTKRISESYLLGLNSKKEVSSRFIVTRFGNVLGSSGSVIPLFKKQIENGGPITLTDKETTRYFMSIKEACQLVIQSAIIGNGGEVFTFDMGVSIKIYDIAKKMIQLSNVEFSDKKDIEIIGLRPGEKLHEEIICESHSVLNTVRDKIKVARPNFENWDELEKQIFELYLIKDSVEIKIKLKAIIETLD
jgi:FlaA1/EpsC-like NDP-sugar epimerase